MEGEARGPMPAIDDAAAVVAAWGALLFAENVALGFLFREQFTAAWELILERRSVIPMVLLALAPASLVFVALWQVAIRAAHGSRAMQSILAAIGAAGGLALGLGVSEGRHFATWEMRVPFVAMVTAGAAAVGAWVAPRIARLETLPPVLGAAGLALASGGWLADAYVLPRLYPAFHVTLLVGSLAGGALVGLAVARGSSPASRSPRWFSWAVALALVVCAVRVPAGLRAIDRAANVRITLVEHAPMAGRFVAALERLRAPAQEPAAGAGTSSEVAEVPRSLDWTGHDLLLLSVDALRADHVSAYGYRRRTTPNLDALAAEGTLFEAAYCPTPHTSYSITSMMTGKYLRPLLALGLGSDSETWAQYLRRYGWRTAAFYPPAVFFIDQERFAEFEQEHLGFEYAKVEFADPPLREEQVRGYLEREPADRPLFLWVHFFEPHEPYVPHPNHVFEGAASRDVDLYDGEVATADDGIGRVVRAVRARRPGVVVIVTADHGEEFGEHGGRYHGTTVYEEQVRVPLVVVGPGVRKGARVQSVAQTIDLLPTVLSALGIPRPARVRGRDLGRALTGAGAADPGFALAETDDASLVASGGDRLVCERRAAACALYRPKSDPLERTDVADQARARFDELRRMLVAAERDHGRLEGAGAARWPPALRRGMQGDVDAAADVAALLDDADVGIRRAAAEVCYELHAAVAHPAVRRAFARDEDEVVRRWCALALVRMGEAATPAAEAILGDTDAVWRRRAALAFAEQGEARACDEVTAWWGDVAPASGEQDPDGEPRSVRLDLAHAEELLSATSRAHCKGAVGALVRALEDVRARPFVADALGALGDRRAAGPLLAALATEHYVTTRPHEARALLALGAKAWPVDAMPPGPPPADVRVQVARQPAAGRVMVLTSEPGDAVEVEADGMKLPPAQPLAAPGEPGSEVRGFELVGAGVVKGDGRGARGGPAERGGPLNLEVRVSGGGVVGVWVVAPGAT
jgi:arylsulfatase A-like enzyme